MQLRFRVAVVVAWAGSCSSNSTPSLGISIFSYAAGVALKSKKKVRPEETTLILGLKHLNCCAKESNQLRPN